MLVEIIVADVGSFMWVVEVPAMVQAVHLLQLCEVHTQKHHFVSFTAASAFGGNHCSVLDS